MRNTYRIFAAATFAVFVLFPSVALAQGRADVQRWSSPGGKTNFGELALGPSNEVQIPPLRGVPPIEVTRQPESSGVLRAIPRYILHHKELLVADGMLWLAESADAASTTHCLAVSPQCTETNGLIGRRPGAGAVWTTAMAYAASGTVLNHLISRYERGSEMRHAFWVWTLPMSITAMISARNNAGTARRLHAQEREHLLLEHAIPVN